jgi:hypothetical protein
MNKIHNVFQFKANQLPRRSIYFLATDTKEIYLLGLLTCNAQVRPTTLNKAILMTKAQHIKQCWANIRHWYLPTE